MNVDLTESVYAMIVLAYSTLAVSSYLFTNIDNRTQTCRDRIDNLITGPCNYLRQANLANGPKAEVISRYDTLLSRKVSEWRPMRWSWVPYMIFASVVGSALLLVPVLLIHLGWVDPRHIVENVTPLAVLGVQILASITVPILALNVRGMITKLRPLEQLRNDLELAALPGEILAREERRAPKANKRRTKKSQNKVSPQSSGPAADGH